MFVFQDSHGYYKLNYEVIFTYSLGIKLEDYTLEGFGVTQYVYLVSCYTDIYQRLRTLNIYVLKDQLGDSFHGYFRVFFSIMKQYDIYYYKGL